ncbi:Gfo/Idh/MocA family protein [Paucisalibacillus sp. EB02]|uniref:Gfo/Idh/MocA family protein n=1 Tax=Paucisalibacillus sp. EB02 TaxID=1347087 RepID=UPI0005AA7C98|nr:Gfo/Idh/MocA family oxidoreductase [Paucisalibacillus sp. EB02]
MQRVGLVGLGFIGKAHLEAYHKLLNAEVVAICTRNVDRHKDILSTYTFISDYEELLIRDDIDLVDICLPTYLHEEYIIKAARAKKNIICEKPLSLSVESVRRILDEVEKCGVKLFVGHVLRFWPQYQAIKAYSETETLKDIEIVHAQRLGQPATWSSWFKHPKKSGGALFDLHLHDIDFIYYLLGEVKYVYAQGTQNQYGAWNHIMTTLTFKGGEKAFVEASNRMPPGYPFTMTLRAQTHKNTLDFHLKAGENIESINNSSFVLFENEILTEVPVERVDPFQNELSYFVDCLENDRENKIVPLDDVLYVIRLLEAINLSLETGHEVHI